MTGAGPDGPEPGDATRTRWPWDSPFAWAVPPRHARYGDGAWLAALRSFWAGRYDISIRRRWFRKEWLAVRKNGSGVPLRGRDHTALSQAMYADWLAETAREAHARAAAAQAAAEADAVLRLPPDDDCVSPSMMTCIDWPPDRHRPYVRDGDAQ